MEIVKVELNLKAINKSIALFNCDKKVSGLIHTTENGETTIVLDGGYVLDSFDCPHCAIEAISLLAVKIKDGEKSGHGSYRQHKRNFMERAFITVHSNPHRSGPACPVSPTKANRTSPGKYEVSFRHLQSTR